MDNLNLDKIKNMIRFSFGADAFAFGYQWTYDITKNLEQYDKTGFELINPMAKKYHPKRTAGDFGPYADQELILLDTMTETRSFNPQRFMVVWYNLWRIGYDDWIDMATKITLSTHKGSHSNEISPIGRMAPLFLMQNANLKEMQDMAAEYIALTHNNHEVIEFGKFIIHLIDELLKGTDLLQAINDTKGKYTYCQKYVDIGLEMSNHNWQTLMEAEVPTSCEIGASGPLTIYLLVKFWDNPADMFAYNAIFDGDTCARAQILALIVGLVKDYPDFAQHWFENLHKKDKIDSMLKIF